MRKKIILLLGSLTLLAGTFAPASADIERKATLSCEGNQMNVCLYIWPALPDLPGWNRDEELSYHYNAAFMAPVGDQTSSDAVVFLGSAVAEEGYKTDHPGPSALDSFIADDNDNTRKDVPEAEITETDPAITADGVSLRIFIIHKLKDGHSQILAFTEDGDKDGKFFCALTLDSKSDMPVENNLPLFRTWIGKYKHWKAN